MSEMVSRILHPTLVLNPSVEFDRIETALERFGWVRGADTMTAPPLIPGEPEFASWSSREGDERVSYTFNPVVRLRVLVLYGVRAEATSAELARALPVLGLTDLRKLLQSDDPRTRLLGIFAARELRAFQTLDLLDASRTHTHATVAAAAQKAHAEMLQLVVEVGAERLREEKRRHPDRSVLFPRLGDAHMRRQTLRWLIRDYHEANEHITAVLRSGLVDEDWEVRATAMLATVRFRAKDLWSEIRRLELPKTSRNGPDESDHSTLFSVRKIALECLVQDIGEQQIPVNPATMDEDRRTSKEAVLRHLRLCMLGLPVTQYDRIFLLINALTEPLEVEGPPPPDSPAIIAHEETYRLKRSGLELCWIPPVGHWLGADDEDMAIQNPIRRFTPDQGYFIARSPMTARDAQRIFSNRESPQPLESAGAAESYLCDWITGVHICERLSEMEGVKVILPTADHWEMAARGTDGRRYPWGSGIQTNADKIASPWGIEKAVGGVNEWTSTPLGTGEHVICGGKEDLRCASRSIVPTNESSVRYAVRPVVLIARG